MAAKLVVTGAKAAAVLPWWARAAKSCSRLWCSPSLGPRVRPCDRSKACWVTTSSSKITRLPRLAAGPPRPAAANGTSAKRAAKSTSRRRAAAGAGRAPAAKAAKKTAKKATRASTKG